MSRRTTGRLVQFRSDYNGQGLMVSVSHIIKSFFACVAEDVTAWSQHAYAGPESRAVHESQPHSLIAQIAPGSGGCEANKGAGGGAAGEESLLGCGLVRQSLDSLSSLTDAYLRRHELRTPVAVRSNVG